MLLPMVYTILERQFNLLTAMQLKRGDPRSSAQIALQLVQNSYPVEVEHFGYNVLQHVVRLFGTWQRSRHVGSEPHAVLIAQVAARWDKFSEPEHTQLASTAFSLLRQGAASA